MWRTLLSIVVICASALSVVAADKPPSPPNIVILFAVDK